VSYNSEQEDFFHVIETDTFVKWLDKLKDRKARSILIGRVRGITFGEFGDTKTLGNGLNEMRVHYGPGYRIYWIRVRGKFIVLLAGGNKSTQSRDIKKARVLLQEVKRRFKDDCEVKDV